MFAAHELLRCGLVTDSVEMDALGEPRPLQHYFIIYWRAAVVIAREGLGHMTGLLYAIKHPHGTDGKSESVVSVFYLSLFILC